MNRYVGCALLLASSVALGQGTTKWVDEKGRVHYGDQPPADVKEQRITKGTVSSVRSGSLPPPKPHNVQDVGRYNTEVGRYNEQVERRNNEEEARRRNNESSSSSTRGR